MGKTKKISVAGIIVEDGKIFIAKRCMGGDLSGKWEFPGGKAEDGENDKAALVREYYEEFGVHIKAEELLGEAEFEHRHEKRVLRAYQASFLTRDFILSEHTEWQWADAESIKSLIKENKFAESDAKLFSFLKF
jgi:8-oxo-dGTP diphosphatase